MFTRALLAVDASKESRAAIDAVIKLTTGGHEPPEVHLLHVLEHGPGRGASYDLESSEEAHACVAAVIAELERAGVESTGEIAACQAGDVGQTIAKTAAHLACDVIVVGTRGSSDLGAAVLGSVAHAVIRHTGGCVLVAR